MKKKISKIWIGIILIIAAGIILWLLSGKKKEEKIEFATAQVEPANLQNSVTIHQGARIGNGNEFFPGASISTKPQDLKYKGEDTLCEIGDNNSIRECITISRGTASKGTTKVGCNNLLMEGVHIAHDCVFGSNCIIGNQTIGAANRMPIKEVYQDYLFRRLHFMITKCNWQEYGKGWGTRIDAINLECERLI